MYSSVSMDDEQAELASSPSSFQNGRNHPRNTSPSVFSVMRRAFSIDQYHQPASVAVNNASSLDSDEDGSIYTDNDGPEPRRWLGIAITVLAVLVVVSVTVHKNNRNKVLTPSTSTTTTDTTTTAGECGSNSITDTFVKQSLLENIAQAAVASDQGLCSDLGVRTMMNSGGNAVDAAVTTALCLGLVNPSSSGLGGGAFMLIHGKRNNHKNQGVPDFIDARSSSSKSDDDATTTTEKVTEVIDCRETAPAEASTYMYENNNNNTLSSVYGGLAISVPGELKCLELAHARFGVVPWSVAVQPVVELARRGAPVGAYLAKQIHHKAAQQHSIDDTNNNNPVADDYGLRAILTKSNNWKRPLQQNDLLKNHALAETLERIMVQGATAALYSNEWAQKLANDIASAGGIVTAEDITTYRATLRTPVITHNINGFAMAGIPPPSSGGAAILGAARFLAGFANPLSSFAETLSVHRVVEACKHVFAIRMSLSDPNFNTDTVHDAVHDLTSSSSDDDYMDMLRQMYYSDNATLPLSQYGGSKWAQLNDTSEDAAMTANASDAHEGDRQRRLLLRRKLLRKYGYLEDHGTSHFSIVDADGNAVSMTTSINTLFGSNVVSPSTGILFSNTMDDFANPGQPDFFGLHPAESNYIQPGKRALSSMSPTMVFRQQSSDAATTKNTSSSSLGDLMLVIGASGGPKIITSVLQVLLRHVMMGMPLLESIVHPRLHDQLIYHGAAVTTAEHAEFDSKNGVVLDVSQRTRDALEHRGHRILDVDFTGTVQAVSIDLETKKLTAASDPRKGGAPAGY